MRRFRFRLEQVLRLKKQWQHQAELEQRKAQHQLQAVKERVQALHNGLTRTANSLAVNIDTQHASRGWLIQCQHATVLQRALEDEEANCARAARAFEQAVAQLARIATEVEALQRLRDQHWGEHLRMVGQNNQEHIDESVLRHWNVTQRITNSDQGPLKERKGDG